MDSLEVGGFLLNLVKQKNKKIVDQKKQLSFTDELETNMGIKDLSEKHNKYFYGEPK